MSLWFYYIAVVAIISILGSCEQLAKNDWERTPSPKWAYPISIVMMTPIYYMAFLWSTGN